MQDKAGEGRVGRIPSIQGTGLECHVSINIILLTIIVFLINF
jgi:hypothetical protein